MEMEKDGTCNCECTCEDGSKEKQDSDGNCTCECECKNCKKSTLGPDGCKCPDDRCPVCEAGATPEWKQCECKCSEDPCGEPPTCVSGRRGPKCKLSSCPSCQSCSGNGDCTTSASSCSSSCQCSTQWTGMFISLYLMALFVLCIDHTLLCEQLWWFYLGSCCESRVPRRRSGDPHLQTEDGVDYDYFGIGEFWDCHSKTNDFGFQVRFYYYGQTSFTGAVAIKAGSSVVTVTTPNPSAASDLPTLKYVHLLLLVVIMK